MSLERNLEDRVLRLTLNRAEKRNALDMALCRDLVAALTEAEKDPQVGVILLDARGTVFCAGMDLDEALRADASELAALHEQLFSAGARIGKPIVAAVQGPALGGGVGLVANAHLAIASQSALFGLTEIRIGLWPFVIYQSVVTAIGERRTLELSLTGRLFGATDALQWGLVHDIVPPDEIEDRAVRVARILAGYSPEALRRGLEFANESRSLSRKEAGMLAHRVRQEALASPDFAEGVNAFREQRKPKWPSSGS